MTTGEIGLRLLKLQQEFATIQEDDGLAQQYGQPGWKPRSQEQIATDYETAIKELLSR